ncbi:MULTISPECIES: FimV/HubP family polar landmark protein [Acidithiobacillus]|uniref:FimV/HubP family polar landmark protein n=1 Tax=Acidithiobacillus TaxID=119977 RepID=UPI0018797B52|nr:MULTISPECIES: FimV/HubP family polar landmark protein [Acidithiobacillus]MBE7567074.1 Motility protein FimV [Acidithiobacillus sp. HP-11]MBU2792554.1 Motility protein FimV [Acidithiobacillus thiooxidans]
MERKNWLWAMAGMGLLLPGLAQALGLGSLQVLSAPGEPFRAEIPIQSVTPQTASSLNASLAPNSAFAMINLPQAPTLEHWQFTVRRGSQPAILISSPLPVSQPNLQFLVQLNWSGGQLVREYSASVANAAAAMPLVSSPAPVAPSAISPASVPATESVAQPPAPARLYHGWSRVNRYGPVPVNSSLYDIAQSITNSNAVTLDQVMSAVVKANPQAFKNANPTYLYAGSMLNLPNVNQVQAMTPAQATAWLSTQSQAGSVASLPATQTSRAATSTSTTQPQKASTSPTESATHLVLSSAPANAVAASAETASATSSPLAVDTLALQTENQKLKSEVTGLGQRLSAEERLLANQGVQLATLSRNSANSSLFNNIPLLISLGGNLLLLILFIWMLRRQKESERRQREVSQRLSTLNSNKSKPVAEPPIVAPAPAPAPAAAYSAAAEPAITPPAVSTPAPTPTPASKEAAVEEIVPVTELAPVQTQGEDHDDVMEIDPIEQADLYLTYGKSEQAITVMNEALDENPRRKELYVKLLDMYATLDRRADYLDLAERMRGRFGPHNAAWQEVAAQGSRLFPGNALFASEDEREADVMVKQAPLETPADKVQEAPATEHDADDLLDFDFSHGQVASTADESFPADEKDRLLQDIDEQFRLMDAEHFHAEQVTGEVESASQDHIPAPEAPKSEAPSAEDTLPFSFGLSPFEEERAPAVPARELDPEPEALREMPKPAIVEETSPAAEDWDAVGTKLDLAKAYVEMGDSESARDLLEEVSKEGSSAQREEAQKMLEDL